MGGEGDKGYVVTSISHRATDPSQFGEPVTFTYTVRIDPAASEVVRKGGWITDVTYEPAGALDQPAVATETLTIAHDGFLMF